RPHTVLLAISPFLIHTRHTPLLLLVSHSLFFFFNDTATTEIYTLSLHDALPILVAACPGAGGAGRSAGCRHRRCRGFRRQAVPRSEEHTSELQSLTNLVCRLLLEKKKNTSTQLHQCKTPSPTLH